MEQNTKWCPFCRFKDMRAVTFVLPDEMADVSIAGLQWFILIPRLNCTGSHRPIDFYSIPYLHWEKKYRIWNKNYQACCNPTNYEESSCSSLILVTSNDMPQRKAEVLFYTVKKTNPGPHGEHSIWTGLKYCRLVELNIPFSTHPIVLLTL